MDWSTFALVGRTFARVFPNGLLVLARPSGIGNDYLLVGFKGRSKLTLENAKRNLPYIQESKNVVLSDPKLLYRLIVTEDFQRLFGEGPVNTDGWPLLEFVAPKLMYRDDPMIRRNIYSERWLTPKTSNIVQQYSSAGRSRCRCPN
jgi:spermidine synthase